MTQLISENEIETGQLAEKMAAEAKRGDFFALRGELGAGKTTFAKYFARALGITDEVTSPTFTIMKTYSFTRKDQVLNLVHIDAYRLENENDADGLGLQEIFNDHRNIILLEWPERIWSSVPADAKLINFTLLNAERRQIIISEKKDVDLSRQR